MIASILAFFLLLQSTPVVPPGAVDGILKTVDGAPAIAIRVVAIKRPAGNGIPGDNLNYFDLDAPVSTTLTDNDGHFSMMDIPPGRYYILAGDSASGSFYPGTGDMGKATVVTVASNEIAEDLNFALLSQYGGRVRCSVKADMAALGPRTATLTGPPLQDLLEVPVKPDGSCDFGFLPPGEYLMSLYPPTSGISSVKVKVGKAGADVSSADLVPLPTQTVTGRIVTKKGPIPYGMYLSFETVKNYAGATVKADGTFSAQLHADTHEVRMAGLPVGYSVESVRVGSQDGSQGIMVGNKDISGVVITLNVPEKMAVVHGHITGLPAPRFGSTSVMMTGPILGALQASIRSDGTFEFPVVLPGSYTLKLSPSPAGFSSMVVTVATADSFDVTVPVPNP